MPASPPTPRVQPDGRWPSTSSPATSTPWRAPELGPLHGLDVEVDREQVLHVEGMRGDTGVLLSSSIIIVRSTTAVTSATRATSACGAGSSPRSRQLN